MTKRLTGPTTKARESARERKERLAYLQHFETLPRAEKEAHLRIALRFAFALALGASGDEALAEAKAQTAREEVFTPPPANLLKLAKGAIKAEYTVSAEDGCDTIGDKDGAE